MALRAIRLSKVRPGIYGFRGLIIFRLGRPAFGPPCRTASGVRWRAMWRRQAAQRVAACAPLTRDSVPALSGSRSGHRAGAERRLIHGSLSYTPVLSEGRRGVLTPECLTASRFPASSRHENPPGSAISLLAGARQPFAPFTAKPLMHVILILSRKPAASDRSG